MRLFQGANERSAGMVAWRRLGVLIRRFSVGLEMQNNAGPVAMIGHQALSTGFGRFEKLRCAEPAMQPKGPSLGISGELQLHDGCDCRFLEIQTTNHAYEGLCGGHSKCQV
jgi:hypothetical protein